MSKISLTLLIDYYCKAMERRNLTADTIITLRRALNRFITWLPAGGEAIRLVDLNDALVLGYADSLLERNTRFDNHPNHPTEAGQLSPYTIRKYIDIVKRFGRWLQREGFGNPFDCLVLPKVPKKIKVPLSDEEKQALFDALNLNTEIGVRRAVMLALMVGSGLRIGEVVGAKLKDLDLARCRLKVMGKGEKERLVPFDENAAKLLMRYINIYRAKPTSAEIDNIILAMDGRPLTRGGAESVMRRLKAVTGIKRLHAHLLRHTFVTDYLLDGGDPMDVKDIVGHTSLDVTELYRHVKTEQVNERFQRVSPFRKIEINGLRRFGNKKQKKTAS